MRLYDRPYRGGMIPASPEKNLPKGVPLKPKGEAYSAEDDAMITKCMVGRTGLTFEHIGRLIGRTRRSVSDRWLLLRRDNAYVDVKENNQWRNPSKGVTLPRVRCLSE